MKFISFIASGRASYGLVQDGGIVDLGARFGATAPTLRRFIELRAAGFEAALPRGAVADFQFGEIAHAPVIGDPAKIICVGLNFEEHRQETGRPKADHPALFTRFADTLVGHGQPILRPPVSSALDYEGEVAVIIGRPGYRVPAERAHELVGGFACFNDATLRDWQRHTHQFTPGKNFPATGGFGPVMVTPDEVPAFADMKIETRLNGAVMQQAHLGEMIFPVDRVIAYVTGFTPLRPGDVIAMGTPGGVGFKREPQLFMKPGDKVEVVVEGIGHLVNPIADEAVA